MSNKNKDKIKVRDNVLSEEIESKIEVASKYPEQFKDISPDDVEFDEEFNPSLVNKINKNNNKNNLKK